ncbi:MAG: beta-lactamase family protein [Fischerella sp.]|nr:beta-lactamase family protein [Fischerella sp.]
MGMILCLFLSSLPNLAQTPTSTESTNQNNTQTGLTTPQELEAFLDKFFDEEMEELDIPGAAISVVKDGSEFFSKGYGYADVEKQTPVIPEKTVFRVGSVSKLFTATAVMQLVERGLLNLDDDVNKYLKDFQIENNFPNPITVKHLLTHTSGFSQRYIGIAAREKENILPLGKYLKQNLPPRVRPSGELYSYSNFDFDLAGYLVEVISGVPFAQYIEENILQPLDMKRSSFRQPLPADLAADLAVGYEYENDNYDPLPSLFLNIVPAGGLSSTATDMTHFMLANLQDGRYENQRILNEKTAQEMKQQQFTDHPKLPGIGYAFHERFKNGQRVLAHSSIFLGYTGLVALIPEQNLGLFIAYNKFKPKFHEQLINRFLNHYYPVTEEPEVPQPLANHQQRVQLFTGTYRHIEYPQHTLAKATSLVNHVSVREGENGTLEVNIPETFFGTIPPQDTIVKLIEVEPLLFYRYNGDDFVAFGADEDGCITFMYHPLDLGPAGFERLAWYETTYFHIPLLIFFLLALLSAFWIFTVRAIIRRFHQNTKSSKSKASENQPRKANLGWVLAGIISTLYLTFLIGMGLALLLTNPLEFIYEVPTPVIILLYLPLIATVLTIALPIFTFLAWRNNYWKFSARLHYSIFTLTALMFIPFLNYWNLLGFRF